MTLSTTTRRPAHLRLVETLVDGATGSPVCECVVQTYRTRKGAEQRKAAAERRAAVNARRDTRYRAVYRIERIPMGERA